MGEWSTFGQPADSMAVQVGPDQWGVRAAAGEAVKVTGGGVPFIGDRVHPRHDRGRSIDLDSRINMTSASVDIHFVNE